MPTQLLKNDKYEIKCKKADADTVEIEINIKAEKLDEKEIQDFMSTIRKILYAFDRAESVSSRYGSVDGHKEK